MGAGVYWCRRFVRYRAQPLVQSSFEAFWGGAGVVSDLFGETVEDTSTIICEGVVHQGADFVCCALAGPHIAQSSSPWVGVDL